MLLPLLDAYENLSAFHASPLSNQPLCTYYLLLHSCGFLHLHVLKYAPAAFPVPLQSYVVSGQFLYNFCPEIPLTKVLSSDLFRSQHLTTPETGIFSIHVVNTPTGSYILPFSSYCSDST